MRDGFTEEQQINFNALRDCPSPVHAFQRLQHGDLRSMRCVYCGGLVGQAGGRWYQRGIVAHSTHPELAISAVPPWLITERMKDLARLDALAVPWPAPMPLPGAGFVAGLPPQTRGEPSPWPVRQPDKAAMDPPGGGEP